MDFTNFTRSRNRILQTLCFLACFVLVAVATAYRNASIPAVADVSGKQVVVLDAGHGARSQ